MPSTSYHQPSFPFFLLKEQEETTPDYLVVVLADGSKYACPPTPKTIRSERRLGSAKGLIRLSDDFDEPLEDFNEYM